METTTHKGEQMTPPKGYKHTELGVLPEDWEVVRLGDVCEIQSGGTPSRNVKKYWENGTIKWLGSSVCKNQNRIDEITDHITEEGLKNSSAKIFSKGTTLIALVGATIGKVAYLPFEASTNQNIAGLQPNKQVANDKFIFYSSLMLYRHFETLSSDKFKMANLSFVRNLQIPLPPLAEQKKIAEILSAWDTQIQNFETLIAEKQTLKKGLCQTLLTAKTRLKGFSEDWEVVRLGEVGEFLKGSGISKDDIVDEGIPCIRYGELYTTYGEKIEEVFSHTDKPQEELVISKTNDVVLPSSGETAIDLASASCILKDGVAIGGDTTIIRSSQNGVFLAYCLNTVCKKQIYSIAQGSSVIHLYANYLKTIKIPIPSLAEQEKIAEILGEGDKEIMLLEQKLESLKSQKRGLMQNLLNGKVRVKS